MGLKRLFMKYVSLNILSMIGVSCYTLADTFFIANGVGLNGLTALNLCLPLYSVIFGLGALIGMGGATRYSILYNQGNKNADDYFTHCLLYVVLVSIPFMIMGLFFSRDVMILLGATGEIIEIGSIYLKTFTLFTPFFIGQHVLLSFIKNDHDPRLASIAMISATTFNIVFDYILVFPCGLGMFGAALATACAPLVAIAISLLHFKHDYHFFIKKCTFQLDKIKHITQIGFPSFLGELSGGIIIFVFNYIILGIGGSIAVASYGIISNLAIVMTSLYTGISQGIQPLISTTYARNEHSDTHKVLMYAFVTSFMISIVVYVFIILNSDMIVGLFNSENNAVVASSAKDGLFIYFIGFFFAGLNMSIISFFAGSELVKPSFYLSMLRGGIVIIPCVLLLASLLNMTGVWLSFPISEGIVFVISMILLKKYQTLINK